MMGQIRVTGDLLGNLNLEIERKFDISLYGSGAKASRAGPPPLHSLGLHNGHQLRIISRVIPSPHTSEVRGHQKTPDCHLPLQGLGVFLLTRSPSARHTLSLSYL